MGGSPQGIDPLSFLAFPLGDIGMFGLMLSAAIALRRDREAHKRLMLLAYASILVAAVGRFPGMLPRGPLWFFGLTFLPSLALGISYDFVSRRRVHPAYIWGGALLILSVPVRIMISTTQVWHSFAERLAGMSRFLV